jgi:hypothetical protein
MGATLPRWPVTGLEWSLAALVLGMTAGWVWPRRRLAATCAVLALLAGAADPLQTWVGRRVERAVVLRPVVLQESGIELQPGQVVTIASHRERRLRVKVGRVATGWLPEDVVGIVRP